MDRVQPTVSIHCISAGAGDPAGADCGVLKLGIVGGSIAGCSAAILLGREGHNVRVLERSRGGLVGRDWGKYRVRVRNRLVPAYIV